MARNSNDSKRSASTVTVACKLPQGLRVRLENGPEVHLHGANSPWAVAGYGLTQGVDADVWEAIKVQHADATWLVNGFVFANGDHDSVVDKATDEAERRAGFEAVDPAQQQGVIQNAGGNVGQEGQDQAAR